MTARPYSLDEAELLFFGLEESEDEFAVSPSSRRPARLTRRQAYERVIPASDTGSVDTDRIHLAASQKRRIYDHLLQNVQLPKGNRDGVSLVSHVEACVTDPTACNRVLATLVVDAWPWSARRAQRGKPALDAMQRAVYTQSVITWLHTSSAQAGWAKWNEEAARGESGGIDGRFPDRHLLMNQWERAGAYCSTLPNAIASSSSATWTEQQHENERDVAVAVAVAEEDVEQMPEMVELNNNSSAFLAIPAGHRATAAVVSAAVPSSSGRSIRTLQETKELDARRRAARSASRSRQSL